MTDDWNWWPARVDRARAHYFDEQLLLHISGEAPTPRYRFKIERSLLDVEPPAFLALWQPTQQIVPQVLVPYDHRQLFFIGSKRDTVILHHAEGAMEVPVEEGAPDLQAIGSLSGEPGATRQLTNLIDPATGKPLAFDEAVGYSDRWDLREAFHDAIRTLPPQRPHVADWLSTYELVAMGAEIGGFAGFDRLFVRARSRA